MCGAVAATLILVDRAASDIPPAAASPSLERATEAGSEMSAFTTSSTTSPPTSSVADLLAGYRQVSGPGGMTTYVPVGWPSVPMPTNPSAVQADEPAATSRFVRYGGGYDATAPAAYDRHVLDESRLVALYQNFARIRLDVTDVRGMPAIDREFQFDKDGVRRHARGVYWIARGREYFVYASAPAPQWQQIQPILDVMLEHSTP